MHYINYYIHILILIKSLNTVTFFVCLMGYEIKGNRGEFLLLMTIYSISILFLICIYKTNQRGQMEMNVIEIFYSTIAMSLFFYFLDEHEDLLAWSLLAKLTQ